MGMEDFYEWQQRYHRQFKRERQQYDFEGRRFTTVQPEETSDQNELTIYEHVGLNPIQAFQKRASATGTVKELLVSPFLFELYIKHPRCFWEIINNIRKFQYLYQLKQYTTIFKQISFYAGRKR